jgi:hypothetical protein
MAPLAPLDPLLLDRLEFTLPPREEEEDRAERSPKRLVEPRKAPRLELLPVPALDGDTENPSVPLLPPVPLLPLSPEELPPPERLPENPEVDDEYELEPPEEDEEDPPDEDEPRLLPPSPPPPRLRPLEENPPPSRRP